MENMRRLSGGRFLVRTQAGFRKAVKLHFEEEGVPENRVQDVSGYPKCYPSVVELYYDYMRTEGHYAYCTPLNRYREDLLEKLKEVENE